MPTRCPVCQATYNPIPGQPGLCPKCGRTSNPKALAKRQPPAAPALAQPPGQVAYDPGYASIGAAPIFVHAKPSWSRPGVVTAGAVCGIIAGAMDIFGAFIWFQFKSVSDFFHDSQEQWTLYGWLDFLLAIGLIVGAAGVFGRQMWARYVLAAVAFADTMFSMYLASQNHFTAFLPVPLYIVAAIVVLLPEATRYFRTRDPTQAF